MRNIVLIVHLSLDGFVAGPNGELSYFSPSEENLAFVNSITANADIALFGRNCYELLDTYWPSRRDDQGATDQEIAYSNWYNEAQKIVVSRTLQKQLPGNVTVISHSPEVELAAIKEHPGKDILIFGSPTLSQFLFEHSLIDEVRAFIHPRFFGNGLRLFSDLPSIVDLTICSTHTLSTGEVVLHYKKPGK